MTTRSLRDFMNRSSLWLVFLLAVLAWLGFSPTARAQDACREGCDSDLNTFLGEDALLNNTDGSNNTAIGFVALVNNTTGYSNTATGSQALASNTDGYGNTANGAGALFFNQTGIHNTANGSGALYFNTASDNTANGAQALANNTAGFNNTAMGSGALVFNGTGTNNTAIGLDALSNNITGSRNVATGSSALYSNATGIDNTATGANALYYNTANYNTAHGYQALENNTTGTNNTASGLNALNLNTTGSYNAASGAYALHNDTAGYNTADGYQALYRNTTGSSNIALGYNAGYSLTTGSNNIDIGNPGLAAESKTIRIGSLRAQTNTYIAGISGVTVAGGVGVIVDTNGHLGTVVSSERFKDAIKPMDKASQAILALKPVTFHYKKELDPDGISQFGLVAEQVERVNPDLVARDVDGKAYTVRYDAVNAMLLNEFLKEHRTVQELKSTTARQEAIIARQQKQIEALTTGLQVVSAQLEVTKGAPQMVLNNHQTEDFILKARRSKR